jgi:hypothetical protein
VLAQLQNLRVGLVWFSSNCATSERPSQLRPIPRSDAADMSVAASSPRARKGGVSAEVVQLVGHSGWVGGAGQAAADGRLPRAGA